MCIVRENNYEQENIYFNREQNYPILPKFSIVMIE